MEKKYLMGIITGVLISGTIAVNASNKENTVQSCAALLPSGHNFELAITGSIDTKVSKREFKGQLGLTDGTDQNNPNLQSASQPFVNCVSALIK